MVTLADISLGLVLANIAGINIRTLTGLASVLILPQDTASSGLAPESEPSNS